MNTKPKKKYKVMIYTDNALDWQHLRIINKALEPGVLDELAEDEHCVMTLDNYQGIVHKNKKSLGIYLNNPLVAVKKKC